jgi:hypothetical protein
MAVKTGEEKHPQSGIGLVDSLKEFPNSVWREIEDPLRAIVADFIITLTILITGWVLWQVAVFTNGEAISAIPVVKNILDGAEILFFSGCVLYFFINVVDTTVGKLKRTSELKQILGPGQPKRRFEFPIRENANTVEGGK